MPLTFYIRPPTLSCGSQKMKKILIVEDEFDFRGLLSNLLADHGYEVESAANGAEGIKKYEETSPDLLLLDVNLPDMSGFDICRGIRSKESETRVPIIMCTVHSEIAPVDEGLRSGADDYIVKPFQIEDLLERIAAALAKK